MRYVIFAFAAITWFAAFAGFVQLRRLSKTAPELLRKAGIIEIDGLFKCIRGIYRLGFTSLGNDLPLSTRTSFKLIILGYVWIFAIGIAILNGYGL